jgi:hypothetical protein
VISSWVPRSRDTLDGASHRWRGYAAILIAAAISSRDNVSGGSGAVASELVAACWLVIPIATKTSRLPLTSSQNGAAAI